MITTFINHKKGEKPEIPLTVVRVEPKVWNDLGFYRYHYLSSSLNPSAKCFVFKWDNKPVAFCAVINQPSKGNPWGYRISRLVVFPSMQNLGIATRIMNFIGSLITGSNPEASLYMMTVHTKIGKYFESSPIWVATGHNKRERKDPTVEGKRYKNRRVTKSSYHYKYMGDKIKNGYEELLMPIGELRKRKNK